jgi:hypothetical protein
MKSGHAYNRTTSSAGGLRPLQWISRPYVKPKPERRKHRPSTVLRRWRHAPSMLASHSQAERLRPDFGLAFAL